MSGDKIYLYPKTSCSCLECQDKYPVPEGEPSNFSVRDCKVSPYFECNDRIEFTNRNIPVSPQKQLKGWKAINPDVYADKYDPYFGSSTNCPKDKAVFRTPDPRSISTIRGGQHLTFDKPPINGNVQLKNIYKKVWDGYGIGVKPYDKINDGQIQYYTDKSIENAFFSPVYGTKAKENAVLYKDPMGSMKPEYNREAVINTHNPATECIDCYPYCLSWMQDTQSHREDLMSLQMRKTNQEKWMPRWGAK